MRLLNLTVAAALAVSTVADAKDDKAPEAAAKADAKADAKDDGKEDGGWEDVGEAAPAGPTPLKVPKEWAGQGYSLRIGSDLVPLDKETISVERSDRRERVDIVDQGGRIARSDRVYVDANMFDDFDDPRQYHLGIFIGGTSSNGKAFRKLLQDSQFQEASFDFLWQPTSIGLIVSLASQTNVIDHDFGVESTYSSGQTRLGVTYEFAPFRSGWAQRLHFLSYVGVLAAAHEIKLEDDEVTLEDESTSSGGFLGVDTMYPLNDFWITIRTYASYQKIEFESFDFETQSVQRGLLFGGYYAF